MTGKQVAEFFRRLAEVNPAPQTELAYCDPYTLLVAVILSAQATDVSVNKATEALFRVANTPRAMVAVILSAQATDVSVNKATEALFRVANTPRAMVPLGEEGLIPYIRTIGLFRNKAKAIITMSRRLLEEHGGQVPADRAALERLPGVGRKTASVVLNGAFGQPTIAVDTHVFRVANRTSLAPGRTPLEVERALEARVPKKYARHAHHWLILHGRYVCTARKPRCPECVVRDLCAYPAKTP